MTEYHYLRHNEIIQEGDEVDGCRDSWRDDPVWLPVHEDSIGQPAPDPRYPAHRVFRRPVSQGERAMIESDWFREKFGHMLDSRTLEQKIEDTIYEHFLINGNPDARDAPTEMLRLHQVRDWDELPVWML